MGLKYTKTKIFHYMDKISSLPESINRILPPVHIRIKPTNICNHNCSYCAYRAKGIQLGEDMSLKDYIPKDKMMEIIDDLSSMHVKAVTFSGGGEPFCYPHMLETVEKLTQNKIQFAALTNGSRLTGKTAELFSQYGTWIRISIDGWDGESYASYRGTSTDEFAKIIKNIAIFSNLGGKCHLGASIIVDKKNANHIYELIKKLKDAGVNSIKVAPCILFNDGEKNNIYHNHIFKAVKQQVQKAISDFKENSFEIFDSYHTQLETFKKNYSWCPYLQVLPVIGADCNVYSCHDKAYNLKTGLLGSIKDQGFKKFWFSDKKNFFKINPSVHCNHHCVVDGHNKMLHEFFNSDKDHLVFV